MTLFVDLPQAATSPPINCLGNSGSYGAIGSNNRGMGAVTSVEMELAVQMMSYINYELLIEWPWQ